MRGDIKPIAELVGRQPDYATAASYVTGLDVLPLGRVVNDEKVTDHHAIIPTRSEHRVDKMNDDDKKVYDMVVRRFLAVFHPEAEFENTRVETTVADHVFRTRGKVLLVPGWRGVYGETAEARRPRRARGRRGRRRARAAAAQARAGRAGRGPRGRVAGEGDQAAAPLQRRLAAGGDGDRGQAGRRRRAARGDEGLGDRHAGHPRGDHRAPDPGRLRRARRPRAGGHGEGPQRDPPARASTRSRRPR